MSTDKMSNFTIRIEEDLKKRFVQVAKANDTDASKEVRKFIKRYLAENSQLVMK